MVSKCRIPLQTDTTMSSHYFPSLSYCNHLTIPSSYFPSSFLHLYCYHQSFAGAVSSDAKHKLATFGYRLGCNAISKPRTQDHYTESAFQGGLPTLKWPQEIVEDDIDDEQAYEEVGVRNEIKRQVEGIRRILSCMEDGEISISAYDTAWVALVQDVNGSGSPQFPSSLEWIANNQLPDGSWGDAEFFSAHDRIINTLACVVALKSWNIHPDKCDRGMAFFNENLSKLENEKVEHMLIGFEVAFPSLLDVARSLNIQIPDDSPILKDVFAKRNLKLSRIPRDVMHKVPTTLLHSLEGMAGLDWEQLIKLQSEDGSFLFSPSSTAFALIHTKHPNCLNYLNQTLNNFNGGVPNVYPVDLFEHIWVVDRLERLGISRYFQKEIEECMIYVYRYWSEKGICWARNSSVQDIDDTAMGFRLLRMHGHEVSADVFKEFERNGEFFCFGGQSTQAVTGMFNLYRASQLVFPGEEILEEANHFSTKFLRDKQAANQLFDKWIIMKNLPGEVAYALDVPWYANLPRVEARFYIDQYGGDTDIWIGKTLYRMAYVNNNNYLELAKLDYNNCQAVHMREWEKIQKWHSESRLEEYGLSRESLLFAYYLATSSIFEAERWQERLAWAKSAALLHTITSYLKDHQMRTTFVHKFTRCINQPHSSTHTSTWRFKTEEGLVGTLVATIQQLSRDVLVSHGHEITYHMHHIWKKWLSTWESGGHTWQGQAELLVHIINLSAGRWISEELLLNPHYQQLLQLTNSICYTLSSCQNDKASADSEMQQLAQLVLQKSSNAVDSNIKNTFLTVAKTFYYAAFFDSTTINSHIAKVLFDKLI